MASYVADGLLSGEGQLDSLSLCATFKDAPDRTAELGSVLLPRGSRLVARASYDREPDAAIIWRSAPSLGCAATRTEACWSSATPVAV